MMTYKLTIPIPEETIRTLRIGDAAHLSGMIVTARDAAHKYMVETFIPPSTGSESDSIPVGERSLYDELKRLLNGGIIYHCGPVVRLSPPSQGGAGGGWQFVAAGPTTSIREEPYEPDVIAHFGLRGVIGKGGMGRATMRA